MGSNHPIRKCSGVHDADCAKGGSHDSETTGPTNNDWDPDPGGLRAADLSFFEPAGCKMMLLEVLRRAAHDWVLYRSSTRLLQRQVAEEAYTWLFREEPGSHGWIERALNKKELTSFVSICDVLSLDPEVVRTYIRGLTVKEILSTGRPPTYRRQKERRRKPALLRAPTPQLPISVVAFRPHLVRPVSVHLVAMFERASATISLIQAQS
jgi:hypothetical protein